MICTFGVLMFNVATTQQHDDANWYAAVPRARMHLLAFQFEAQTSEFSI